ncbi:MAG: putative glycoside hydrolase, partial [Patescibacteria group bacterium]
MGRLKRFQKEYLITSAVFFGIASLFFVFDRARPPFYTASDQEAALPLIQEEKVQHLKTPESLRAIYMTSWVAGTKDWRESLVKFIDSTELNAVVIDVKDYTGRVSFETGDSYIQALGASEKRIPDIKEFIKYLHEKNIYVIARISVFQDQHFVSKHPEFAVKKKNGAVWKDRKGLTWVDPASREFWNYIVLLAKESERVGFDELNFDYIRFPSDGNMQDIAYDYWDEKTPRAEVIKEFFSYLRRE